MATEGLIVAAKAVLDGKRDLKNAALKLVRAALNKVMEVPEGLIQGAIDALHAAGNLSDELHSFDLAKSALKAGEVMAQGIIDTAQKGLDARATYTEFLFFNVAEKDLLFAKHNNQELNLAQHAIDVTEGAVNLVLISGNGPSIKPVHSLILERLSFPGPIASLIADGPLLIVNSEGLLLRERIEIYLMAVTLFNEL